MSTRRPFIVVFMAVLLAFVARNDGSRAMLAGAAFGFCIGYSFTTPKPEAGK